MADWTFGLGKGTPAARAGNGSAQDRKAAEAWVRNWSGRFKEWWQSTNMSQSELAKKLGVSPMTISRWTRGKARPTSEAAAKLERLLTQELPQAASKSVAAAAEPGVGERLSSLLEELPAGKRIAHLLESLGRAFEHALSQAASVGSSKSEPAAPAPSRAEAQSAQPASSGRRRGAETRSGRGRASAAAATPARSGAPRRGGSAAASKATPEALVKSTDEEQRSSAASSKGTERGRTAGRKGRSAKAPEASWPDVIQSIQAAEGWGEGRNRKLADALRVAPSTISNWLGGHRTPRGEPRDKLSELARKHGISTPA